MPEGDLVGELEVAADGNALGDLGLWFAADEPSIVDVGGLFEKLQGCSMARQSSRVHMQRHRGDEERREGRSGPGEDRCAVR